VTQKLLHGSDIIVGFEEVGSKTVTHVVEVDVALAQWVLT